MLDFIIYISFFNTITNLIILLAKQKSKLRKIKIAK